MHGYFTSVRAILGAALLWAGVLGSLPAFAFQSYYNAFENRYPSIVGTGLQNQCIICHTTGSGGTRNSYGLSFENRATHASDPGTALAFIEGVDSDLDGFTNFTEISAFTFPGDAGSFPVNPNEPPILEFIGNQQASENALLSFVVTATDFVDGAVHPTISVSNGPSGSSFTDNGGGSRTFSWTPRPSRSP